MSANEGLSLASQDVVLDDYTFCNSARHGCAQLVLVKKASTAEEFSGKLIATEKESEFLQLEGAVHKVLKAHPHPSILQPLAIVSGSEKSGVIFPAVGEDLHSYVRNKKMLPEREAKAIFRSIVEAVCHCHAHRIVLRDLRLGKIFFQKGSSTEIVIGDLDGAQVISHAAPFLSDRKGSPEVLVSHSFDGAAADMWALGVILFIILTGTYPFQDTQIASLFQKIQKGHAAVHFPKTMSEAARDIVRSLLVKEPHLRLTARELLDDLWLSEVPPAVMELDSFIDVVPLFSASSRLERNEPRRRCSSSDYEPLAPKRARTEFDDIDEDVEDP